MALRESLQYLEVGPFPKTIISDPVKNISQELSYLNLSAMCDEVPNDRLYIDKNGRQWMRNIDNTVMFCQQNQGEENGPHTKVYVSIGIENNIQFNGDVSEYIHVDDRLERVVNPTDIFTSYEEVDSKGNFFERNTIWNNQYNFFEDTRIIVKKIEDKQITIKDVSNIKTKDNNVYVLDQFSISITDSSGSIKKISITIDEDFDGKINTLQFFYAIDNDILMFQMDNQNNLQIRLPSEKDPKQYSSDSAVMIEMPDAVKQLGLEIINTEDILSLVEQLRNIKENLRRDVDMPTDRFVINPIAQISELFENSADGLNY